MQILNKIPGTAIIALLTALTLWLQTYYGSWQWTAEVVGVVGFVLNMLKIYFAEPEVPVSKASVTSRGVEPLAPAPGKLFRFFF